MSSTPPQTEQVGESAAPDSHRSLPTPFLTKTYQLVDDPAIDDIISWNEDGTTFVVWRPAEFARDLLPKYFKHNNFSSFVRQLNTYGFRKIVPDRWEFANDCFKRGEKRLLCDIHRRKITPAAVAVSPPAVIPVSVPPTLVVSPVNSADEQVLSSTSSPGAVPSTSERSTAAAANLIDENERLQKENMHLNHELSQMKALCNNIMLLMSKYANSQQESGSGGSGRGGGGLRAVVAAAAAMAGKEKEKLPQSLELMPMKSTSSSESTQEFLDRVHPEESGSGGSPMLFGVHIGVKRLRVDDEGSVEDHQPQPQPQQRTVKSEPLDCRITNAEEAQQDPPWLAFDTRSNQRVSN